MNETQKKKLSPQLSGSISYVLMAAEAYVRIECSRGCIPLMQGIIATLSYALLRSPSRPLFTIAKPRPGRRRETPSAVKQVRSTTLPA